MKIGVLGVQGAFAEPLAMLDSLGVESRLVRLPHELEGLSGLILPGGESTALRRLIDRWGLRDPILDMATNFNPSQLTTWGQRIFNGTNGIKATAREATIFSGQPQPTTPATVAPTTPTTARPTTPSTCYSEYVGPIPC